MDSISVNQEKSRRTSVKFSFQSMLMLMAAIMMAFATLTSCDEDEDPSDDPDEIENGNNGSVAGKRLKTWTITYDNSVSRGEYTYNSDGSLKQVDYYDANSNRVSYDIITNNPDGTTAKSENINPDGNVVTVYTYDPNKKPKSAQSIQHSSMGETSISYTWTFQNGRLIRYVQSYTGGESIFEPKYDSQGKRTTTTETHNTLGTCEYTRTYNSDGTLQMVSVSNYSLFPATKGRTETFIWEDGKTNNNLWDLINY